MSVVCVCVSVVCVCMSVVCVHSPKTLEVTCVGENVILDNLNVFRMNGFHFKVDTSGQL